ncbi:MAG: hypothetical protein K2X06_10295, partial [Burkholderiales bacterium]|nr:hypothetical protein [Burkholderiales bacterium]
MIEDIKLGISIVTLASIVIAFLSYRANLRKLQDDRVRDSDKELINQARSSFQWAYDVLRAPNKMKSYGFERSPADEATAEFE